VRGDRTRGLTLLRKALFVVAVLLILGSCAPAVPPGGNARAADHYVSPHGRDSASGTRAAPWRTLRYAFTRLRPGDTLEVRGGDYYERVLLKPAAGTATSRITVRAAAGERPVLHGLLWLGAPSYWTISGLNVTWGSSNTRSEAMVRLYGGTGWVFENAEVWGARSVAGLMVNESANNTVAPLGTWKLRGLCVHDTLPSNGRNQDHNVYVDDMSKHSPAARGVIEHSIFYGAPNGNNVKLGPGGDIGGPHHVSVRYSSMYDANRNISVSKQSHDITMTRNLLVRAKEANIFGYMLAGSRNTATDNVGSAAPRVLGNTAGYRQITGASNKVMTPGISVGCRGFRPTNSPAAAYGRYAL
jgi:hypothetical protein